MRIYKLVVICILVFSQLGHSEPMSVEGIESLRKNLETELRDTESNLEMLSKARTTGQTFTVGGAAQQLMVISSGLASYLLLSAKYRKSQEPERQRIRELGPYYHGRLKPLDKELGKFEKRSLGVGLGVAALAEKIVVFSDASTLSRIMEQKRQQLTILADQIEALEKSIEKSGAEETKESLARRKDNFKKQSENLKLQLEALEISIQGGPMLTNSIGKYAAAITQLVSMGLIVNSFTNNKRVLGGMILTILAGESFLLYYIDINAVDQTILQLQSRRLELISRINQLN